MIAGRTDSTAPARPDTRAPTLLPTTVVGSYPPPGWLIDRGRLGVRVPRVPAPEIWRVAPECLAEAQDDATRLAVRDMELAGIDIVTDGEIRRESYSSYFAAAFGGVDVARPGTIVNRLGRRIAAPRIVGPLTRRTPIGVRDVAFLRRLTAKPIKVTLPGPFTLAQQSDDTYYRDDEALAMAFAAVVNAECLDLIAAGVDVIQLDEPWLEARPELAARYAAAAIDRALEALDVTTAVHVCFGYAAAVPEKPGSGYLCLPQLAATRAAQISIEAAQPRLDPSILAALGDKDVILGVIDLAAPEVETPDVVAARIRAALPHVPAERLTVAPDCGMKYLPRDVAFGKLCALVAAAAQVRDELTQIGARGE